MIILLYYYIIIMGYNGILDVTQQYVYIYIHISYIVCGDCWEMGAGAKEKSNRAKGYPTQNRWGFGNMKWGYQATNM